MRLSEHFVLAEFTRSQTATRNGIDNTPNPQQVKALTALCENVLERVRATFGPVLVSSGFRSAALNKAIGGSNNSQHSRGQAADIQVRGVSNKVLAEWIRDNCDFDQLILEFHNPHEGPSSGWVHVSWNNEGRNRKQSLTASRVNGKTVFTNGIK